MLTTIAIAVCFGAAGYWAEGAIAGLGGGLSNAYLVRSSIGRIDTDQLNLGFIYLMFGLVTFAGLAKSQISSLAWCFAAGLTANLFMWWYGKPELVFVVAVALGWILICLQRKLVTAVCGTTGFLLISGITLFNPLENAYLHRDIARGVGVIGPDTPAAELARLHRGGIRGARLMNLPGGAVGLEALGPVDAMACDMGWSVNVQFDGGEILDRLPALKGIRARWILDHHGKFFAGATPGDARIAAVKRLIDRGNCWFKMAGGYESSRSGAPDFADIGAVAREIIAHAPERVIWGTNWPHNLVKRAEDYPSDADLLDTVLGWAPDEATRRLILVDNPAALYGFGAD